MAPPILDRVPLNFPAGTTVKFSRQFDEFPSVDGWAYTIYLNGTTQKFNKAAVVQEDGSFLVTFIPADTASLAPGAYRYAERVTNSGTGEAYDLHGDELVINIEPNAASSDAGAFVSFEEKTLSVLEAAISGRLTADIQSYQIAGRAVNKIPIEELMQLRGKFAAMVWRKQNPGKLGQPYRAEFPPLQESHSSHPTWVDVTGFIE